MGNQVFYEDVEIGREIPTLVKHPTTRQLVKWAGATEAWSEIHYDKDYALSKDLPGVIIAGWQCFSFLGQIITNWIGESGTLVKMGCSYRGMSFPGEDFICKGRVAKKYIRDGKHYVEVEMWVENPRGEKLDPGSAVVILSSRGSSTER